MCEAYRAIQNMQYVEIIINLLQNQKFPTKCICVVSDFWSLQIRFLKSQIYLNVKHLKILQGFCFLWKNTSCRKSSDFTDKLAFYGNFSQITNLCWILRFCKICALRSLVENHNKSQISWHMEYLKILQSSCLSWKSCYVENVKICISNSHFGRFSSYNIRLLNIEIL